VWHKIGRKARRDYCRFPNLPAEVRRPQRTAARGGEDQRLGIEIVEKRSEPGERSDPGRPTGPPRMVSRRDACRGSPRVTRSTSRPTRSRGRH
jgi:hypothetical protein